MKKLGAVAPPAPTMIRRCHKVVCMFIKYFALVILTYSNASELNGCVIAKLYRQHI